MKYVLILTLFIVSGIIHSNSIASEPITQTCSVRGVAAHDSLTIREKPGAESRAIGVVPHNGKGFRKTVSRDAAATGGIWYEIRYGSITGWANSAWLDCRYSPDDAKTVIADISIEVLQALRARDMKQFGKYVHPVKGVRFTPYAHVDIKNDRVFQGKDIAPLNTSGKKILWGEYDATGDSILLSFSDYISRFVYDRDFIASVHTGFNKFIGSGNTINNMVQAYPNSIFVEYHFPGTDKYSFMDWSSVRIVFEKYGEKWFVSGIVHSQWTS